MYTDQYYNTTWPIFISSLFFSRRHVTQRHREQNSADDWCHHQSCQGEKSAVILVQQMKILLSPTLKVHKPVLKQICIGDTGPVFTWYRTGITFYNIVQPPGTHLHLLHFPLRHYLTNQPYQLFESGALPNYNLCRSEDADECKSITGRPHQPPLTLCVGLIDLTLLIPLQESLRDADGVDSQRLRLFLFRQRADRGSLSLHWWRLILQQATPKAKFIILEMVDMPILSW